MKKPTLTLNAVYQDFNLAQILGFDLSLRPELGISIGQSIIDFILERTRNNEGIGGVKLDSPYSDEYAKSDAFIAYGKSKNDVNMELTGSMLADLDILEFNGESLRIGFRDDTEIKKAYNHNTGDTVPERPFFGLTSEELDQVLSDYSQDIEAAKRDFERLQEQETTLADIFDTSLPTFRSQAATTTLLDLLDDERLF